MLITPTFQVYLGDVFNNTNPEDILAACCISCALVGITVVYSIWLEGKEARTITAIALIVEIPSYFMSIYVFSDSMSNEIGPWYWVGLVQAALLDTVYKSLMWMPAYVQVTKMIPADVEVVINSIVKTMQAGSIQVYGRLLGTGLT